MKMKLLFLVIFLSSFQDISHCAGLAGSRDSGLVKPKTHAHVHEGEIGVLTDDSGTHGQGWFNTTSNGGKCYTEETLYSITYNAGESLQLKCPLPLSADFPRLHHPITWKKNCLSELGPWESLNFKSLTTDDAGYYTCTWSFRNGTKVYNMSRTNELTVNEAHIVLDPKIIQPLENAEIKVDVGKKAEVLCVAVIHSDPVFELIVWMKDNSLVGANQSQPVYSNSTVERQTDGKYHMNALLVFKRVSPKHLNTKYTCKLESTYPEIINVSITLSQIGDAPSPFPWLGLVAVFAVIASAFTVIYVKLRIDIVLFFRELSGTSSSVSDGKQYDAYIMYYKAEEALTEEERRLIPHILETEFGYRLCLYERDILPGRAVSEAVLEHIVQSRRLLLLPGAVEVEQESWVPGAAAGPGARLEQGLLSGLHAALVDRQTRLVLVERAPRGELDSLPEALRLLGRSGGTVAWRGDHSAPLSSAFWKKLRYYMPAAPKSRKHRAESMSVL